VYGSIWVSVCVYVYASRWLAAAALACCFIGAPIQVVQFIYAGMVMDDCAVPEGRERERERAHERERARARVRERESESERESARESEREREREMVIDDSAERKGMRTQK